MGEDRRDHGVVKRRAATSTVLLDPTVSVTKSYGTLYTPTVSSSIAAAGLSGKSIGVRARNGEKGRALLQALLAR